MAAVTAGAWRGLGQRFGFGPVLPASPVWLHAASAGEVQAAAILVAALRRRDPQLPLLITATTAAGLARARRLFAAQSIAVCYLPLDLPGAVRRFLRRTRPRVALVLETEIWPNLIRACATAQVPVMFVSARLSARSAQRYRRLGAGLRRLLATVAQVAAQTPQDAERFAALGVPATRIQVTGNLKADFSVPPEVTESGARLRAALGPQRPIWVAGSTHEFEEQQVLQAHRAVLAAQPQALLILVPRHARRFGAVADWLQREQMDFVRRSRSEAVSAQTQVLLIDAMGMLLDCYAAADVAFVGGSLVKVGGHNLLEPAALGRPILTGPGHANAARNPAGTAGRAGRARGPRWCRVGGRRRGAARRRGRAPAHGRAGAWGGECRPWCRRAGDGAAAGGAYGCGGAGPPMSAVSDLLSSTSVSRFSVPAASCRAITSFM